MEKLFSLEKKILLHDLKIMLFLLKHEQFEVARVYYNEYLRTTYPFVLSNEETKAFFFLFDKIDKFFNDHQYQINFPTSQEEIESDIREIENG